MGEINTTNLRDKGQKVIIDKISKASERTELFLMIK